MNRRSPLLSFDNNSITKFRIYKRNNVMIVMRYLKNVKQRNLYTFKRRKEAHKAILVRREKSSIARGQGQILSIFKTRVTGCIAQWIKNYQSFF